MRKRWDWKTNWSVVVGMQADLLLMQENPLRSVKAYDQIQTVFLRGKPVQREQLSATALK